MCRIMWRSEGGGLWWACRVDGNRRLTCWRASLISVDADLNCFVLFYFCNEIELGMQDTNWSSIVQLCSQKSVCAV